jgi:hypothetical protein
MPVLQFRGKTAIENYHHTVPRHLLDLDKKLSVIGKGEEPRLDRKDRKTPLPRKALLSDEGKLFELVKRDGLTLNISGCQEIEEAIRKKRGGVWLELTPEQYAKLRQL